MEYQTQNIGVVRFVQQLGALPCICCSTFAFSQVLSFFSCLPYFEAKKKKNTKMLTPKCRSTAKGCSYHYRILVKVKEFGNDRFFVNLSRFLNAVTKVVASKLLRIYRTRLKLINYRPKVNKFIIPFSRFKGIGRIELKTILKRWSI